jgi:hypothetical protein
MPIIVWLRSNGSSLALVALQVLAFHYHPPSFDIVIQTSSTKSSSSCDFIALLSHKKRRVNIVQCLPTSKYDPQSHTAGKPA